MDNFTIVVIILAAISCGIGVFLLVKQRLPGLGFFLICIAIALLIGIGMEPDNFKWGFSRALETIKSII